MGRTKAPLPVMLDNQLVIMLVYRLISLVFSDKAIRSARDVGKEIYG